MIYAYLLDLVLGDPLWFPHPIKFIGHLINSLEKAIYKDSIIRGFIFTVLVVVIVISSLYFILFFADFLGVRKITEIFIIYTALATNSLYKAAVLVIKQPTLALKQKYLGYIVSRDTSLLDESSVNRSVIETVSENTIDGIISPIVYTVIGYLVGYPVLVVYFFKVVSTLDSMVGYKNDKYLRFGKASARLDDILNFVPARIGSIIILIAGLITRNHFVIGVKVFIKDRLKHKSPNAGHPESAVAGLLDIKLGGPNYYHGRLLEKPYLGNNPRKITEKDCYRSLHIMIASSFLTMGGAIWILIYMGQTQRII